MSVTADITADTITATCDTHGELSEAAGTLYVWRKPTGEVGRTKCRACERDKAANRSGRPAGERKTRQPRQSRQAAPTAHLAGPTRESVLRMLEALDVANRALTTNDASRPGESPLKHAHRIANERKGALVAVTQMLTDAAEQAGLAGLLDSTAPVAAAVGAE